MNLCTEEQRLQWAPSCGNMAELVMILQETNVQLRKIKEEILKVNAGLDEAEGRIEKV